MVIRHVKRMKFSIRTGTGILLFVSQPIRFLPHGSITAEEIAALGPVDMAIISVSSTNAVFSFHFASFAPSARISIPLAHVGSRCRNLTDKRIPQCGAFAQLVRNGIRPNPFPFTASEVLHGFCRNNFVFTFGGTFLEFVVCGTDGMPRPVLAHEILCSVLARFFLVCPVLQREAEA